MVPRRYFGTDGVRGKVGEAPITPDWVLRLGNAAGRVLATGAPAGTNAAVLIGKDTRISGYLLESALEAGLAAAGIDVLLAGPMPTPAIAYLTRALRLAAGIVISASHNPFDDNGIKFFGPDGYKLADEVESAIEAQLDGPVVCQPAARLGKARRINDAAGRYIEFCKSTFPAERDLRGLRVVVDCANGAAYHVAGPVLHELGAEVQAIAAQPDGVNINDRCGATYPALLAREVPARGADLGIALDGDADRLIMVDRDGRRYDGDQLLYVIARHRLAEGRLGGGVVGTLMTNFGLERSFQDLGVPFARAAVGDRHVLELLRRRGWLLGGENSGHIVCLDRHTTGDGLVSTLQVLHALRASGQSLAQACEDLQLLPQVMVNVPISRGGFEWSVHGNVARAVAEAERSLAGRGRVLLRASGTEPVVRVMVEGETDAEVRALADSLASEVRIAAG
jgi:phosphoglucosamine mutase